MPKVKTRKSVTRRFKITKLVKILRRQSFRRHLKASKSKKRLTSLKRVKPVEGYYAKKLRRALGVKKIEKETTHGKS